MEERKIGQIKEELKAATEAMLPSFIMAYESDERSGVIKLVEQAKKRLQKLEEERKRIWKLQEYERKYGQYTYICGIDEVGRGPLAGPVVAGAVILPKDCDILYINDSKKLTAAKREELYDEIMEKAVAAGIGMVSPQRIDEINILQATYEAMREAISKLEPAPDILLNDAGITGREHLKDVRRAAFMGMSVDAIVRILLFLAVLGVVSMGFALDPKDPAGSAFLLGAGEIGHKLFGIVFFCAALTSVVGAAYTSVSFLKTLFKVVERYEKLTIMAFIFVSTCILIFIGKPATLLIVAGSVNGLILPVTLAVMLLATRKTNIVGDYKHNPVLFYTGWIVVLVTAYIGVTSLQGIAKLLG